MKIELIGFVACCLASAVWADTQPLREVKAGRSTEGPMQSNLEHPDWVLPFK